jgi:hypothetical protein
MQLSKKEVEEIFRVEQLSLRQELIPLERRIRQIYERLAEIKSSEGLVEGMDGKISV